MPLSFWFLSFIVGVCAAFFLAILVDGVRDAFGPAHYPTWNSPARGRIIVQTWGIASAVLCVLLLIGMIGS